MIELLIFSCLEWPFPNAHQLIDGKIQIFVSEKRRHGSLTADDLQIHLADDEILVVVFCLGNPPAGRIQELGAAPKPHPILETHPVSINQKESEGLGVGAVNQFPVARIIILDLLIRNAPKRTGGRTQDRHCPIQGGQVYGGWVPEILTNENSDTAKLRVERAHPISPGKIALLIKHPVGRQIDLAMDMADFPIFKIDGGVIKSVVRTLLYQPGDETDLSTELFQLLDLGSGEFQRDVGDHIAQKITRETQLRKK